MFLAAALLLTALTPTHAQEVCGADLNASPVGDLNMILADMISPGPVPGDYNTLSPEALKARVVQMNARAQYIAPYADSWLNLMDQVAGYNFSVLSQVADGGALSSPYNLDRDNPFARLAPKDWSDIPYVHQRVLQAVAQEMTRQLREDLRAGNTSAALDPRGFLEETTPEGALAALRLNHILQQNQIPQDFRGHSPASAADVEGLQGLMQGHFPDVTVHPAAFSVISRDLIEDEGDETMFDWSQRDYVPERLQRKGLPQTLPNASRVAEELDELVREKAALNAALESAGLPLAETDVLDAVVERVSALDTLIASTGQAVHQRLQGFNTNPEVFLPAPVVGAGGRGYETHRVHGRQYFYPSTSISPRGTLSSPEAVDEAVRVKDSALLLLGNHSGFTLKDVEMSPTLRRELGLEDIAVPVREATPAQDFRALFELRDSKPRPSRWISDRPRAIDEAALLSVEDRKDYLLSLSRMTYRRSLQERSATELTEHFDNTWLNRTVEIVDFPGWIFKGKDPENWIGPRSELYLYRAKFFGDKVEGLTDQIGDDAIFGQYQSAMGSLREAHGLNNIHASYNSRYEELHEQTEFETGLFIATLPLSALGSLDTGVDIVRRLRNLRASTRMARAAGAIDDVARAADDLLLSTDELALIADDFSRIDDAGFLHRVTPVEDEFVDTFRKAFPDTQLDEMHIRQQFRDHYRFDDAGRLRQLQGREPMFQRRRDIQQLMSSDQYAADLRARGVSQERIDWMRSKQAPLSFESPEQYQQFQKELDDVLKKMGIDDTYVELKGTSTTFYSENPDKPFGHHFDAKLDEVADVDLGLVSPKMLERMEAAGMSAHPKLPHLYKTRHTYEVFPELQTFSQRWEGILGREINFVGLTSPTPPALSETDYIVRGLLGGN